MSAQPRRTADAIDAKRGQYILSRKAANQIADLQATIASTLELNPSLCLHSKHGGSGHAVEASGHRLPDLRFAQQPHRVAEVGR